MKTGAKGLEVLAHYEQGPDGGHATFPYQGKADKPGVRTVGFGHVIRPGQTYIYPMNRTDALKLLAADAAEAEAAVNRLVTVPLTQEQFDALVCFTFNCGQGREKTATQPEIPGLITSTLLKRLNTRDYAAAAAEFQKWNKSNGQVQRGLIRRRRTESTLFTTGALQFTFNDI